MKVVKMAGEWVAWSVIARVDSTVLSLVLLFSAWRGMRRAAWMGPSWVVWRAEQWGPCSAAWRAPCEAAERAGRWAPSCWAVQRAV